jgi:3-hydroxyisobutyrate dehydrogenase-like beta-hydroxyacid dehydrogenase
LESSNQKSVGIIGIGLLGTALVHRMARAGFSVVGFDPDPAAGARLENAGGVLAQSPEHVAQQCRRILFSLPGPREVQETLHRIDSQLVAGMIVLDTTTGDPEAVETAAAELGQRRILFLVFVFWGILKKTWGGLPINILGGF